MKCFHLAYFVAIISHLTDCIEVGQLKSEKGENFKLTSSNVSPLMNVDLLDTEIKATGVQLPRDEKSLIGYLDYSQPGSPFKYASNKYGTHNHGHHHDHHTENHHTHKRIESKDIGKI